MVERRYGGKNSTFRNKITSRSYDSIETGYITTDHLVEKEDNNKKIHLNKNNKRTENHESYLKS